MVGRWVEGETEGGNLTQRHSSHLSLYLDEEYLDVWKGCAIQCGLSVWTIIHTSQPSPAAVLSTPSMPLAPLLAAIGTPMPAPPSAPDLDSNPDPEAPGGPRIWTGAPYMSMSLMGMLLPRNTA